MDNWQKWQKNDVSINIFKSLMFLLGIKQSVPEQNTTIKKYDFELAKDVNVKLAAHTAVMGKKSVRLGTCGNGTASFMLKLNSFLIQKHAKPQAKNKTAMKPHMLING